MGKKLISIFLIIIFSVFLISCNNINNSSLTTSTGENKPQSDDNNVPETPSKSGSENTSQNKVPEKTQEDTEPSIKTVNCRIFLFNIDELQLYYIDKDIVVEDNALVTALTKELQTNDTNTAFLNLTDKVAIKSAELDKGVLTVIFNKSYVDEMILGSATESGLLSSLVNTFGYNYGVTKVAIYFDDELYTSLKGELPEGYFNTYFSNAKPYISDTSSSKVENRNCRLYFYNGSDDCFYYTDSNIKVTDKALVTALTTALTSPPKDSLLAIPSTVTVTSAKLDTEKKILTVNLTKSYYAVSTKVGSGSEAGILTSLAMTYGYNYNIDKVIILIDGKPYNGSHFILTEGQCVGFDLSSAKPLN